MQYLLDTSTCVFFLRGKLHLDEIIKEKGLANDNIKDFSYLENLKLENWLERN